MGMEVLIYDDGQVVGVASETRLEDAASLAAFQLVVEACRRVWGADETVAAWLTGRNSFLGGARPVDVLRLEGVSRVLDALEQEAAGSYA